MSKYGKHDFSKTAPAIDENGQGCWNVWVDDAVLPETFHSHGKALTYAERMTAENRRVFTDFDGVLEDSYFDAMTSHQDYDDGIPF